MHQGKNYQDLLKWGREGGLDYSLIINELEGFFPKICNLALFMIYIIIWCEIWCHLYNLKNMKNTHEWVLHLIKLQALAWNFTKINTPPWVFSRFLDARR